MNVVKRAGLIVLRLSKKGAEWSAFFIDLITVTVYIVLLAVR